MTNMNVNEFIRAVDHAAGMNDRWLFIASLVVIGIFGVWVVRYFVKQHERLLDAHRISRECFQESLQGLLQVALLTEFLRAPDHGSRSQKTHSLKRYAVFEVVGLLIISRLVIFVGGLIVLPGLSLYGFVV